MTTFQILAIPACLLFAGIASVRRERLLTRRQSLSWAFLWFVAGIVIALPEISNRVAHLVGIGRGADLILYLMCFVSILLVLYFYQKQRRLEISVTELVRNDAMRSTVQGLNTHNT
jgi:hypothetical protein